MTSAATFRFSASTATSKQVEEFREAFGRNILKIGMDPISGAALQVDMTLKAFADLGLGYGSLSPMRNSHSGASDDGNDVVFVFVRDGAATLSQGSLITDIKAGQAVQTVEGESAVFTGHTHTRVTNLKLRRELLDAYSLGSGHMRCGLLTPSPALRLLAHYVDHLEKLPVTSNRRMQRAISTHVHELAALALRTDDLERQTDLKLGVRAARLAALKADIVASAGDGHLALNAVAVRHGISPRYVRTLFEQDGTSFSEFILECRLQMARTAIADPAQDHVPVSTIAFAAGFNDLSYFNRTFKRRFGLTPTDMRLRDRSGT